jgi:hypothetical protein
LLAWHVLRVLLLPPLQLLLVPRLLLLPLLQLVLVLRELVAPPLPLALPLLVVLLPRVAKVSLPCLLAALLSDSAKTIVIVIESRSPVMRWRRCYKCLLACVMSRDPCVKLLRVRVPALSTLSPSILLLSRVA